ncbi:LysR family transcriptional regulator [Eubacterium oxidoreducens]|uniref:DNA-binding transcriptional regulator, LysR family n=1 Tax=Eubacterium oxidoreducens TaxID=1732 RepID=A0A1G6AV87_EUBOX|nr:LysR family transcriptional regulator [Eubacterium oxidoreducens]SDB12327.1 DNA-binding transcriptional regulator, LysR family [Eubacterium oxidoreducens]
MTTFQIKCFLAVADTLNFTKAAQQLFIAQSSLSRNIFNLEKEIGLTLLNRNKKTVRLTPAGSILYEEFTKTLNQIEQAIQKASATITGSDRMAIGILETQRTANYLPQAVNQLRAEYPNISATFQRGTFKQLRDWLAADEIDLAITLGFDLPDYQASMDVSCQSFIRSLPICALSRLHPLAEQQSITFEDLKNDTLVTIGPEVSSCGYEGMILLCQLHGFEPKDIITTYSLESSMLILENNNCFSIIDENSNFVNNPALRCIPISTGNTLNVVAIWKNNSSQPYVSHLVSLLTQTAKK